ncbi:MAG: hypothetical protein U1F27_11045 [Turneriella sp.]
MQHRRTILFILLAWLLSSCSWTVPFYVINNSAVPRAIEIQLSKDRDSFLIFDPRHFAILPWDSGEPDYEHLRRIPQTWRENMKIEIPPHSALDIGRLNNDKYDHHGQQFINGRIFNLVRLKSGNHEVTRDTFDRHFQKTSAGILWILPAP